jgi:hypothetical protein
MKGMQKAKNMQMLQQQRAAVPGADKVQLGWDLAPFSAIIGSGIFVAAVIALHIVGAFLR